MNRIIMIKLSYFILIILYIRSTCRYIRQCVLVYVFCQKALMSEGNVMTSTSHVFMYIYIVAKSEICHRVMRGQNQPYMYLQAEKCDCVKLKQ